MDLTKLQIALEETFAANFISYYKSHYAHVNITGEDFYQNHKLLQKVYEYFQNNIDTIAEKIKTIYGTMPPDLKTIIAISPISADSIESFDAKVLLTSVLLCVNALIDQYQTLNEIAAQVKYIDIENFAQDQVGQLAKIRWMIEATLV